MGKSRVTFTSRNTILRNSKGCELVELGIESGNRKIRVDSVKGRFDEIDVVDIVGAESVRYRGDWKLYVWNEWRYNRYHEGNLRPINRTQYESNFNPTMIFPFPPLFKHEVMNGVSLPPTYSGYSYYSKDSFPNPTENLNRHEILKFRDEG